MAKYGYYSISASVPFTLRLPIQAFCSTTKNQSWATGIAL